MRPYKVSFHLYAENEEEVSNLQRALYEMVMQYYEDGILITADKAESALRRLGSNPFTKNYFK